MSDIGFQGLLSYIIILISILFHGVIFLLVLSRLVIKREWIDENIKLHQAWPFGFFAASGVWLIVSVGLLIWLAYSNNLQSLARMDEFVPLLIMAAPISTILYGFWHKASHDNKVYTEK